MRKLPNGWIECELSQIAVVVSGYGFPLTLQGRAEGDIPFFKVGDISKAILSGSQYLQRAEHYVTNEELKILKAKRIPKQAVVFAKIGEALRLNRRAILMQDSLVDNNVMALVPSKEVDYKYLYYFFLTIDLGQYSAGNAVPSVRKSTVEAINVPFAPFSTQKRIVAKLDTLFAHLDQLKSRLEKIPGLLKQFRQAVLTQAVTGKLTEEWRLLNKDLSLPKKRIDELIRRRQQQNPKVKISNSPIQLPNIPNEWCTTQLLNIAEVIGGVTKGRKFNGKKTIQLPYLRVANVQDGFLNLTEIKTIEVLPEDLEKYRLLKDDILFTEGGDRDKLGRGTVWNNQIKDCIHQNHIFRARGFKDTIIPAYVSLFTKSESARTYFFENASQTVNLASINLTMLSNVPIAVPSIEEQSEIVRRVESLFAVADRIEGGYKTLQEKIDQLPQAILSKAFRGELVAQEMEEEVKKYKEQLGEMEMAAEP